MDIWETHKIGLFPSITEPVKAKKVSKTHAIKCYDGSVFGSWTALYEADRKKIGKEWKRSMACVCVCGTRRSVLLIRLLAGGTSCGCRTKSGQLKGANLIKHGEADKSPEYIAWTNLKNKYDICSEWINFSAFLNDVGRRPTKDHRLIRKADAGSIAGPSTHEWGIVQASTKKTIQQQIRRQNRKAQP
jgi:hypothetical protein